MYQLQGEGELQTPLDEGPWKSANIKQGEEVAPNKELEASEATFANHDSAGDNIDMEYQRFVDVTADCDMEKEIKKHHRGVSVFYQNRGVFHVVHNWPKVEENFVKALEFDCPNGMPYLSRGRAHTATVVLKEFLIPPYHNPYQR
ncbi:GL26499 [Drosophila persimilis]|uniref:GL26499 n=1 Tax=Drosophila persimilis TaxID=7234 RepID=B4GSF3_DROPE|nr:GL26499 [Drosophila persimilis]